LPRAKSSGGHRSRVLRTSKPRSRDAIVAALDRIRRTQGERGDPGDAWKHPVDPWSAIFGAYSGHGPEQEWGRAGRITHFQTELLVEMDMNGAAAGAATCESSGTFAG